MSDSSGAIALLHAERIKRVRKQIDRMSYDLLPRDETVDDRPRRKGTV
jgi:hypothetical protein